MGHVKFNDFSIMKYTDRGLDPLNPETPARLASFLMDTMNKESDGEALTIRTINEIANSGPEGRQLLENTRRRDDYWFAGRSVASLTHSVARIRAMIAGRLGR